MKIVLSEDLIFRIKLPVLALPLSWYIFLREAMPNQGAVEGCHVTGMGVELKAHQRHLHLFSQLNHLLNSTTWEGNLSKRECNPSDRPCFLSSASGTFSSSFN